MRNRHKKRGRKNNQIYVFSTTRRAGGAPNPPRAVATTSGWGRPSCTFFRTNHAVFGGNTPRRKQSKTRKTRGQPAQKCTTGTASARQNPGNCGEQRVRRNRATWRAQTRATRTAAETKRKQRAEIYASRGSYVIRKYDHGPRQRHAQGIRQCLRSRKARSTYMVGGNA